MKLTPTLSILSTSLLTSTTALALPKPESDFPAAAAFTPPKHLRATALTTTLQNTSTLQCWQIRTPFTTSTTPGVSGSASLPLANISLVSYAAIPPHFDGGLHIAPAKQIVVFLSGLANVSIPDAEGRPGREFAVIKGGENGLIVAADTEGRGHITRYTSGVETRVLQMPFEEGPRGNAKVPGHRVLRANGACWGSEQLVQD